MSPEDAYAATQAKPENQSELFQHTKNFLAANNLADTPANRLRAEDDFIQKTKINPQVVRVEGYGNIRQNAVFDTKTGATLYMNSNDLNALNKSEPGRFTVAQEDPTAQGLKSMGVSAATGPMAQSIQSFRNSWDMPATCLMRSMKCESEITHGSISH